MTVQLSFRNVQNVSVKSKFHLEIHYPNSSRGNKHATFLFYDSRNVTQNQGDSQCMCRLLSSMGSVIVTR